MTGSRRSVLAALFVSVLGASAACIPEPALAQAAYPSKPIQLVIPYPPGGSDVLARKLVVGMGQALGQSIVVVNKPGASTQVASAFVAAAAPDGYTLYFANPGELAAGPSFFKSIPFDALKDFTLISYAADAPFALVVGNDFPAKSVAELVTFAKANADKVKFGSYGVQSQPDIAGRRFNMAYGTQIPIIPYQGGAPALNAIVRNEVQLLFPTLIASRPFIVNNQMRPLAIASENRVPLYPDVPTFRELGVDLVESASFGLMGPKGLPADIVKRLNQVLLDELKKPEIKAYLDSLGIVPVGTTPDAFAAKLKSMTDHWTALAPKLGIERQ